MNKWVTLGLIWFTLFLPGCRQQSTGDFGIYLLKRDISAVEQDEPDLSQIALQDNPLIGVEDIVSYDKGIHEMELTKEAYTRLHDLFATRMEVSGIPFVVCVGEQPIYGGAFWTPVSSISYDGVVILQSFDEAKIALQITLGYPSREAFTGADPRADTRILKALEAGGKLK